jgi:NAD(P)H-hydrate repair Nnr-like enzyme with NAD(P)H-hydrate dehydratase domain
VLDADGLVAFEVALGCTASPDRATPHPGEAALGATAADVNRDCLGAARRASEAGGGRAEGAATVVATPDGFATLNPTGGPASRWGYATC